MPGRLGHVGVEADDQVEGSEGALEPVAVRGGDDRVAGDRDQGADAGAVRVRGVDLLGQGRSGELAEDAGQAAYAGAPPPRDGGAPADLGWALGVGPAGWRQRPHHAAGLVQRADHDVDDVDQPRRDGAQGHGVAVAGREPRRGRAHPPVDGRRRCGGELVGEAADGLCRDARDGGHRLRGEGRDGRSDLRERSVGKVAGGSTRVDEVLLDEDARDGGQEERIAARPDGNVLVRCARGPRADGVDDDESSAPLAQGPQASRHVGRRHHRAVRDEGIGSEDEEVVGAVDVGDGDGQRRAEHQGRGHLLRELVDGAGRVPAGRAEGADEGRQVERARRVVHVGVSEEQGDGVRSVRGDHGGQAGADQLEGVVPGRGDEATGRLVPDHGRPESVGIVMQLPDGRALGADEAAAEDVIHVTADGGHLPLVDGHAQPARGLAQRADVQMVGHAGTLARGWTAGEWMQEDRQR